MPDVIHITVQGDEALTRQLARAEAAVSDRAIRSGLSAGALIVTADAKRRAPIKTGTLRRSITQAQMQDRLAVRVGTDVPYAARLEYGFTERDKLGRRYNQPARPYLRPALRENADEVRNTALEVIRIKLRQAMV